MSEWGLFDEVVIYGHPPPTLLHPPNPTGLRFVLGPLSLWDTHELGTFGALKTGHLSSHSPCGTGGRGAYT